MSTTSSEAYSLETLVEIARRSSPYYRELYAAVPEQGWRLADLPIVDQATFWAANTMQDNRVLTAPMADGIIFKSGGTTGAPKFSVYSKREWNTFTQVFGSGIAAGVIEPGDRVANLFYAGELYSSFLFITYALQWVETEILQFPVSGAADTDFTVHTCQDFGINVLAGVPTTIIRLAEHVLAREIRGLRVQRVLFGGENMYDDQRDFLARVFPGVTVASIGYASVDAGLLGYSDRGCKPTQHRVFGRHTILEIVDEESGMPIDEVGRPGRVLITNLTRKLMPIIRYPAGDRAVWVDPPGTADRTFAILGRSEEGARIGPVTLYVEDIRKILSAFEGAVDISAFQMAISHEGRMDRLTVLVACHRPPPAQEEVGARIREAVYRERPMFAESVDKNLIHPLEIRFVQSQDLQINPRTGKLKHVVDLRLDKNR